MSTTRFANAVKCRGTDYIDFLIASPRVSTWTEAAAVQPESGRPPPHDAFTRLVHRQGPDPQTRWGEARPMVRRKGGLPVLDDSTRDNHYAKKIELVSRHWSGKHERAVWGVNLITMAWTDGDRIVPCDYRIYAKANDGLAENDRFLAMLRQAHARGLEPRCVVFDSWYSGLENLEAVRAYGWTFLARLKVNREVDLGRQGYRAVAEVAIASEGTIVHLEGFGSIRVFEVVPRGGGIEYRATDGLTMDELTRLAHAEQCWAIENYHRGLKPCCGVGRSQVRAARARRNRIGLAIRAFLRLGHHFYTAGVSWYEAKARIIRGAVRAYLTNPVYRLS